MNPDVAETLFDDIQSNDTRFGLSQLPEGKVFNGLRHDVSELSMLSYGTSLDYNRRADTLWDNMIFAGRNFPSLFDPDTVVRFGEDGVSKFIDRARTRYPSKDAHIWFENSKIISRKYDGTWWSFLDAHEFDGPSVRRALNDDEFLFLKGDKLAPFWLKLVDRYIHNIDNLHVLEIPVDTHVRTLTHDLVGAEITDDSIREFWRESCEDAGVDMMQVDTALWLVGNNWGEWGEEYWKTIT